MKTTLFLCFLASSTLLLGQEQNVTQKETQPTPGTVSLAAKKQAPKNRGIILATDLRDKKLVKPSTVVLQPSEPKKVATDPEK